MKKKALRREIARLKRCLEREQAMGSAGIARERIMRSLVDDEPGRYHAVVTPEGIISPAGGVAAIFDASGHLLRARYVTPDGDIADVYANNVYRLIREGEQS